MPTTITALPAAVTASYIRCSDLAMTGLASTPSTAIKLRLTATA